MSGRCALLVAPPTSPWPYCCTWWPSSLPKEAARRCGAVRAEAGWGCGRVAKSPPPAPVARVACIISRRASAFVRKSTGLAVVGWVGYERTPRPVGHAAAPLRPLVTGPGPPLGSKVPRGGRPGGSGSESALDAPKGRRMSERWPCTAESPLAAEEGECIVELPSSEDGRTVTSSSRALLESRSADTSRVLTSFEDGDALSAATPAVPFVKVGAGLVALTAAAAPSSLLTATSLAATCVALPRRTCSGRAPISPSGCSGASPSVFSPCSRRSSGCSALFSLPSARLDGLAGCTGAASVAPGVCARRASDSAECFDATWAW